MRDFVLDSGFLQSCIDLPAEVRARIVRTLRAFTKDPRNRDLGVSRVEGSKQSLSLPVDETYRLLLRRERRVTTLLFVTENVSTATPITSNRGMNIEQMVIAPPDALEALLVEEKYLLLARHLLTVPAENNQIQFRVAEIEEIVNAHLPPEARRFPSWWANQKSGKRAHAFAWMAAGWQVTKVDMNAHLVEFGRRNVERAGAR